MNALSTIVKEGRITRRQARESRRLKDYRGARELRRCADTYMKCARIVRKALIKDEADKHNDPQG
jgi:hypothetical protein